MIVYSGVPHVLKEKVWKFSLALSWVSPYWNDLSYSVLKCSAKRDALLLVGSETTTIINKMNDNKKANSRGLDSWDCCTNQFILLSQSYQCFMGDGLCRHTQQEMHLVSGKQMHPWSGYSEIGFPDNFSGSTLAGSCCGMEQIDLVMADVCTMGVGVGIQLCACNLTGDFI